MIVVTLPWPSSALSGHVNGHWRTKAAVTKEARSVAFWIGKQAGLPCLPEAALTFTFHPPARGGLPDVQNMPGRCKAYIDGLAQAMGCDDRKFRPRFPDHLEPRQGAGAVVVSVEA
jgi:hypothetical protein